MTKKVLLWSGIAVGACILLLGAVLPAVSFFVFKTDRAYSAYDTRFTYLSQEQTAEDLTVLAENLSDRTVTLVYQDRAVVLTGAEIGAAYDTEATALDISAYFETQSPLQRFYSCYLPNPDFSLTVTSDRKQLLDKLWSLGYREANPTGYPTYQIEGTTLHLTPGNGKNVVDEVGVMAAVLSELETQSGEPVTLLEQDSVQVQLGLEDFAAVVSREPKNAEFSESANEVIPHQDGIALSVDPKFSSQALFVGGEPIHVSLEITAPEVTTEELQKKLFRDLLGTHTSLYNEGSVSRSHNVRLAASKLHNRIFNEGAVFSYNDLVGQRTAAAGFQAANVYVGNKVEQGIGGGICQVSSTLYAAALRANLEIVERTNHSMPVSYMPSGMDATVSYGSIDLKLKNNTAYPIRIEATAVNGRMTVNIYGTREDDSYDEIVLFSEAVSSIPFTTVEEPTEWLVVGESRVIQSGSDGGVYRVYQQFRKNGQVVQTVLANKSTYQPTPKIVQIGTVPVEVPPVVETPVETPVEPTVPEPTVPTEPTVSDEPVIPAEPTAPVGPAVPIEPIDPVTPTEPPIVLPVEPEPPAVPLEEPSVQI